MKLGEKVKSNGGLLTVIRRVVSLNARFLVLVRYILPLICLNRDPYIVAGIN